MLVTTDTALLPTSKQLPHRLCACLVITLLPTLYLFVNAQAISQHQESVEWLLGEAVTNQGSLQDTL